MIFNETDIKGCFEIECFHQKDIRGSFTKIFNNTKFVQNGINFCPKEVYFTASNKNVARGLHFQVPPYDHSKLVICTQGEVTDFVLDLRKSSSTYKKFLEFPLSENNSKAIFIPKGCAHGFLSLQDNSILVYLVETEYDEKADSGILINSVIKKLSSKNLILSNRDKSFVDFNEFNSPFL